MITLMFVWTRKAIWEAWGTHSDLSGLAYTAWMGMGPLPLPLGTPITVSRVELEEEFGPAHESPMLESESSGWKRRINWDRIQLPHEKTSYSKAWDQILLNRTFQELQKMTPKITETLKKQENAQARAITKGKRILKRTKGWNECFSTDSRTAV